ncbi:CPBP family intramembrane glutamic endopeptidase [Mycolicibacterium bacteremicum]|uniref:CAAX protease family protein n=1 Tax=Mycolicibacterium bacteremicum TaxID=564198 RepID=A0A1W9YV28_MYCBA|nr:type II CAAX endopeptidase family protein [Mycolicibacterium bacteremicum]MCV7431005.1 CPBP family intramembrane metalloprotease [Mycolicibacterium bacteremicum]ORA03827.1 CAAX protease family protein [Mycolicibacterium bacteremicum]
MTHPTNWTGELRRIAGRKAPPSDESAAVVGRRKFVVGAVLLVGAALLGYSLSRPPGDDTFIWLTLALAGVWAIGAYLSGPLHMGRVDFRGRMRRPVITGTAIGLGLSAVFVVGGLVAREIPGVNDYIRQVLEYSKSGPLYLIVFITVINGLAEEMFFRGSLYTALLRHRPVLTSTVLYVIATAATTGNPMLGVAAIILGTVCAVLRRATGGVLAPMLVHFFWGLVMVLALPPMFGV